ncbi:hypothetical protein [Kitasatospora mediocidica]|uniref:hypothetical protein n=1 Tax=Kitasatospora mediocidica TaxID=58352 RepID=UPI00056432B7|nr:hypothetical protein [Kitasatospora mediocidica]
MSADQARTMGLTAREIAEAIATASTDDLGLGESAPTRPYGAPDIGTAWLDNRPAAWNAFGEPREDQQ